MFDRNPPAFETLEDARRYLRSFVGIAGITNLAYLAISLPFAEDAAPLAIATYSAEWASHYLGREYFRIDPAIIQGLTGILPFDWSSRPYTGAAIKRFFGEAKEFGVSHQGLSFPIRGAYGEKAMFSINSDLSSRDWEQFKSLRFGEIAMFAYFFHLEVLAMCGAMEIQAPQLSKRETDVLKWASEGKSAWESAKIMGLTENTANFYLRNAISKLSSSNKTQAVAVAVRRGIL